MGRFLVVFCLAVCISVPAALFAATGDYPTKPVTIVIPVSPGGSRDIQCRLFGSIAEKMTGQPFVPVNKPGASGLIGLLAGAQAAPDGYTLTGTATSDMAAVEWELVNGRKPNISFFEDFAYIGTFSLFPHILIVPAESRWKTLDDFMKDAKANPGKYAFSSGGLYAGVHLTTEYFTQVTGLKFRHVPYNGGGPAVSAIVGNQVDFGFATASSCVPLIRGKKVRGLAVQSEKRFKFTPDIPTMEELGVKDNVSYGWIGLMAPKKTPLPVLDRIRALMKKATEDRKFAETLEASGDEPRFMDYREMEKYVTMDAKRVAATYKRLLAEEKAAKK